MLVLVSGSPFEPSPASSEHLQLARPLKAGGDQPTIKEETAQHHPGLLCAKQMLIAFTDFAPAFTSHTIFHVH